MTPQIWWHLARASGTVAWLMLTASVLWGVVLSSDLFPAWRRPAWILSMHRWLAGLTVVFLAGHLGALLADRTVHFSLADVLVPYAGTWRPTAVAVGVVALYALMAVELTALATRLLPKRVWRDVHILSYFVFWGVTVHAALAGTDASRPLYLVTSLLAIAVTAFAVSYRVLTHHLPRRRPERA